MQLKLVTFDKDNYSINTKFINLEYSVSVEYRSSITGEFCPSNSKIPSMVNNDIVAMIFEDNSENIIKISKHQGAYLLHSGKTIELINKPSDFDHIKIWIKCEEGSVWELESLSNHLSEFRSRRPNWKYIVLPTGTDPNRKIN